MIRELWWMIDIQNDGVQKPKYLILLQRSKRWDNGLTEIVEQFSEYWFSTFNFDYFSICLTPTFSSLRTKRKLWVKHGTKQYICILMFVETLNVKLFLRPNQGSHYQSIINLPFTNFHSYTVSMKVFSMRLKRTTPVKKMPRVTIILMRMWLGSMVLTPRKAPLKLSTIETIGFST